MERIDEKSTRMTKGDTIIKYKFPPATTEEKYVVAILVYQQIKKKTKSEIRDIVDSLEKNHRDPDNQGAYLVPALWRHKTPFAGTFVLVNNDLEPEEKSILSGPSSIGKKTNTNNNSECHQSSDKRTCIHFNFRLKVASDWLHIMYHVLSQS